MKVFISHAHTDESLVKKVAAVLARIFHKKAQTSCKSLIEWKV
jgi:hypothetical protein